MTDPALIAELERLLDKARKGETVRTPSQNRSLHLLLTQVAQELNESGQDVRVVLKQDAEIPWDSHLAKEFLWRPIQRFVAHKESSADLSKEEIQKVYEVFNRHLGEKTGVHVPWPSIEAVFDSGIHLK